MQLRENGHFVDPLRCSGQLVSLHLCFYTSTITEHSMYTFYFRILRADTDSYVLRDVYLMQKAFEIGPSDVIGQTFVCSDLGDYIAVYIPSLSKPLIVVGMIYLAQCCIQHRFEFPNYCFLLYSESSITV